MMQSKNLPCNALQTMVGLFLHSCNTPEKVVETLLHIGLTISPTSINNVVLSTSTQSFQKIKAQFKLPTAQGFDNLDVQLKTEQPMVEGRTKLLHMATATFLPLIHALTMDDLKFTKDIWDKSEFNPNRIEDPPAVNHDALCKLVLKASWRDDHAAS